MRNRIFGNLVLALVLTIGVVLTPGLVIAAPSGLVQFDAIGPSGELGTITYDGISTASGAGLLLNSLSLYSGGSLVFDDSGNEPQASPYQYSFNTATGLLSVDFVGGGLLEQIINTGTIMSGTGNFVVTPGEGEVLITGIGFDTKDILFLAALFGVSADQFDPAAQYEFGFSLTADNSFDPAIWNVSEATITNQVPEPASLLLLSLGLVGCGFFRRRKTKV
jgi:hypothetical protein